MSRKTDFDFTTSADSQAEIFFLLPQVNNYTLYIKKIKFIDIDTPRIIWPYNVLGTWNVYVYI